MKKFLFWLSGLRPVRFIEINNQRYLERYFLFKFLGITFYLHRFIGGDTSEKPHDHPFDAISIILTGCYKEEICRPDLERGYVSKASIKKYFNFIPATGFHKITQAEKETWCLFIHGSRYKKWGFIKKSVHICYTFKPLEEKDEAYEIPCCVYYQPNRTENTKHITDWHRTAPIGKHTAREGLNA